MSYIVLDPKMDWVKKELQFCMQKYGNLLKEINTDVRVIYDEFNEPIALVPRIHMHFKDNSDYLYELGGENAQH